MTRFLAGPRQLTRRKLDAFFPEGGWPGLLDEGPFRAPRFGAAWTPVALLTGPLAAALESGLAGDGPDAAACAAAGEVMAQLRAARVGGAPGLADPGPAGLGLPAGEAVLLLDPGDQARAGAARAMLAALEGRPVLVALDPDAPPGAGPVLAAAGARVLPGRPAP